MADTAPSRTVSGDGWGEASAPQHRTRSVGSAAALRMVRTKSNVERHSHSAVLQRVKKAVNKLGTMRNACGLATEPVPLVLKDLFGIFGDEIAKRMPKLILSAQSLSRFPLDVLRCTALQRLDLAQNQIAVLPGDRMLTSLPNLEELDLSDNMLENLVTGLCVDALGRLPKLATLDLRRNPLKGINQRLDLIGLLVFDGNSPASPKSAWLPAAQSVEKKAHGLVKKVIKDPKVLTSVKMDANPAGHQGPISISKRLTEEMGRPVHFCDMNVAVVPRLIGRFKTLTRLNDVPVSVEDLDGAVEQMQHQRWYAKYPRIQCQKHLRCATVQHPDTVLAKHHKREKRQADAEVRRFNARLTKPQNKGKSSQKPVANNKGSFFKKLAAKRDKALVDEAAAKQEAREGKTKARVEALIKYGHLDGGAESEIDTAWVHVRGMAEEDSDEEYSTEEADALLQRLKFKSLLREQKPAEYIATLGQGEREDEDEKGIRGQTDSMLFLTKDPLELSIDESAKRELSDSRALLVAYKEACKSRGVPVDDFPEVFTPDDTGLTFEDYLPFIEACEQTEEPKLNRQAASKRLTNMKKAVQGRIRRGWDKKAVSLHELIVRMFQKQQLTNDDVLEQLERQLEAYHVEDPRAATWEAEVAFKTTVEVKQEEHELKAECGIRFQVKPVNMSKQLESCHLEGRKSLQLADNTRMVEAEKRKIRYEHHRERVHAIHEGRAPPDTPGRAPPQAAADEGVKSPPKSPTKKHQKNVATVTVAKKVIDAMPMNENGWAIKSAPRKDHKKPVEKSYTDLLESAMDVRKTIVDDISQMQYKTSNFKASAREVDENLQDDFYMMSQFYARRNTSLEDQTLKIGDTDFSFADEFRTVGQEAKRARKELLSALKPL